MRTAAVLAGLIGGLAWIVAYVLVQLDQPNAADATGWAGLVLLGVATLAAGAGLVSRSAGWLRVLVAVCFTLLVWSVLQVLAEGADEQVVRAVAGAVAVVVGLVVLARQPARAAEPSGQRSGGAHAR